MITASHSSAESEAQRYALLHLLAIKPISETSIQKLTHIPPEPLSKHLSNIAERSGSGPDSTWNLSTKRYKELDVWNFPYTGDDRQCAIERAIHALDWLRLNPQDKLWQRLLPKTERGKGKTLSKLSLFPTDHRKLLSGLDGKSTSRPNSPNHSGPATAALDQAENMEKNKPKNKPASKVSKSANARTTGTQAKPKSPNVPRAQADANNQTRKRKVLSDEFVHSSDDESHPAPSKKSRTDPPSHSTEPAGSSKKPPSQTQVDKKKTTAPNQRSTASKVPAQSTSPSVRLGLNKPEASKHPEKEKLNGEVKPTKPTSKSVPSTGPDGRAFVENSGSRPASAADIKTKSDKSTSPASSRTISSVNNTASAKVPKDKLLPKKRAAEGSTPDTSPDVHSVKRQKIVSPTLSSPLSSAHSSIGRPTSSLSSATNNRAPTAIKTQTHKSDAASKGDAQSSTARANVASKQAQNGKQKAVAPNPSSNANSRANATATTKNSSTFSKISSSSKVPPKQPDTPAPKPASSRSTSKPSADPKATNLPAQRDTKLSKPNQPATPSNKINKVEKEVSGRSITTPVKSDSPSLKARTSGSAKTTTSKPVTTATKPDVNKTKMIGKNDNKKGAACKDGATNDKKARSAPSSSTPAKNKEPSKPNADLQPSKKIPSGLEPKVKAHVGSGNVAQSDKTSTIDEGNDGIENPSNRQGSDAQKAKPTSTDDKLHEEVASHQSKDSSTTSQLNTAIEAKPDTSSVESKQAHTKTSSEEVKPSLMPSNEPELYPESSTEGQVKASTATGSDGISDVTVPRVAHNDPIPFLPTLFPELQPTLSTYIQHQKDYRAYEARYQSLVDKKTGEEEIYAILKPDFDALNPRVHALQKSFNDLFAIFMTTSDDLTASVNAAKANGELEPLTEEDLDVNALEVDSRLTEFREWLNGFTKQLGVGDVKEIEEHFGKLLGILRDQRRVLRVHAMGNTDEKDRVLGDIWRQAVPGGPTRWVNGKLR